MAVKLLGVETFVMLDLDLMLTRVLSILLKGDKQSDVLFCFLLGFRF